MSCVILRGSGVRIDDERRQLLQYRVRCHSVTVDVLSLAHSGMEVFV